ncbi:MAG: hypothetical protein ACLGGV_02085 [Bacteroidia bacterium]
MPEAQVSHNIQHNIDGNLLFFIVDNFVYEKYVQFYLFLHV